MVVIESYIVDDGIFLDVDSAGSYDEDGVIVHVVQGIKSDIPFSVKNAIRNLLYGSLPMNADFLGEVAYRIPADTGDFNGISEGDKIWVGVSMRHINQPKQ